MLSVKLGGIKYHFWVFGMTRPGIEPRSPRPLAQIKFCKWKKINKDDTLIIQNVNVLYKMLLK